VRKQLLLASLLVPSLARPSGYALPNTNPRDLAMCASAVAAQRDSGAALALPAALARLDGTSAGLSVGAVSISSTWSDPTGAAADVDMDKTTPLATLSVAYGGKLAALGNRGWGVGVGFDPFGGAIVDWPDDWAGRYRIVDVDRRVFRGALTGGIEVLPRVRLGGGLVYYYTTEELSQHAFMQPFSVPPNPATPDAVGTLDVSGGALSFDVSAEIQPLPDVPLTLAVDYKHKATQELDGDVTFTGVQPGVAAIPQLAAVYTNQGVEHTLTIPNLLNIGLAYRPTKPLLVTFTYTLDRWRVYDEDRFVGDNGAAITVDREYSNGYTLRAGAEYDISSAVQVRAGLQRDESGLTKKFYSPTLPDESSWAGALGATFRFGRGLSIDAAVFYAMMDEVTAEDPNPATPGTGIEPRLAPTPVVVPEGTFRGKYDTSVLIFGVSLAYSPPAR